MRRRNNSSDDNDEYNGSSSYRKNITRTSIGAILKFLLCSLFILLVFCFIWFFLSSSSSSPKLLCKLPGPTSKSTNSSSSFKREAYITLVSEESQSETTGLSYVDAAIVLIHGLRSSGSTKEIVVLASEELSAESKERLLLHPNVRLLIMKNIEPPLAPRVRRMMYSFSKIWAWTLTEYSKLVYIDADHLILQNIDDLFSYPELSASPELIGPPPSFFSSFLEKIGLSTPWNPNTLHLDALQLLQQQRRRLSLSSSLSNSNNSLTPEKGREKEEEEREAGEEEEMEWGSEIMMLFQCGLFVIEPNSLRFEELQTQKDEVSSYGTFGVDTGFMNCFFKGRNFLFLFLLLVFVFVFFFLLSFPLLLSLLSSFLSPSSISRLLSSSCSLPTSSNFPPKTSGIQSLLVTTLSSSVTPDQRVTTVFLSSIPGKIPRIRFEQFMISSSNTPRLLLLLFTQKEKHEKGKMKISLHISTEFGINNLKGHSNSKKSKRTLKFAEEKANKQRACGFY
jgi:ABC-type transport system involved in multi-copper enzyme maturation permease subunit